MSRKLSYEHSIGSIVCHERRSMRVLLIVTQVNYPWRTPSMDLIPQGPAYVAGSLKAHGHDVRGVCTSYDISGEPAPKVLERRIREGVEQFQPEVVCLGGMAAEYLFLRDAIRFCRQIAPDIPVICGGSIVTNDPTSFELLNPDFAVRDEAEVTLIELLDHIDKGKPVDDVAGVIYWKEGKPVQNRLRPALEDLDNLPYPDYEVLDIDNYMALSNQLDNYWYVRTRKNPRLLPISSGRSCPYKCTFCQYSTVEGSRRIYRGRTMESVIREVVHFHDKYNFNILTIYDDLFSVKEDRILEFCELIRKTGLDLHWNASMRVGDVTLDLLKEMKASGCQHIGYGFESADDTVLKSMKKVITQDMIARAIDLSERAGIGVQANFIYGDPAETPESIGTTKKFYRDRCIDHIVHNDYIMPYPGSPIFDYSLTVGAIKDRKMWYDTVHLRPRYNMTKMPEQQFNDLIETEIRYKLPGVPLVHDARITDAPRDDFQHPYFESKFVLDAHGSCPHCDNEIAHYLPVATTSLDTVDGCYSLMEPFRQFCPRCHRRLAYSTLGLIGLHDEVAAFAKQVERLAESSTAVVLAPQPGYGWMEILELYGVPWQSLNIRGFMTPGIVSEGAAFLSHALYSLDASQILRHAHLDFVVLPGPWENRVVKMLRDAGAPRIHALQRASEEAPESRVDALWVKRTNGLWWWADRKTSEGPTTSIVEAARGRSPLCTPISHESRASVVAAMI